MPLLLSSFRNFYAFGMFLARYLIKEKSDFIQNNFRELLIIGENERTSKYGILLNACNEIEKLNLKITGLTKTQRPNAFLINASWFSDAISLLQQTITWYKIRQV